MLTTALGVIIGCAIYDFLSGLVQRVRSRRNALRINLTAADTAYIARALKSHDRLNGKRNRPTDNRGGRAGHTA